MISIPLFTEVHHPGTGNIRAVIPLTNNKNNFAAYYAFSSVLITNGTLIANSNYSNMVAVERQEGVIVSGSSIIGKINLILAIIYLH